METTPDKLNSIGEMIGDEANRKLDLIAKGPRLAELGRNVMNSAKDCALSPTNMSANTPGKRLGWVQPWALS